MDNLPVIAIRFALYADLMVLAGMTAFTLYGLTAAERASASLVPLRKIALVLSALGLILSGGGLLVLVASMMGTSLFPIDLATVRTIIVDTSIGTAWIVRMVVLAAAFASALALDRFPAAMRTLLLLASSFAIATLVWTGHAGATEGAAGTIHRVSDIAHMLAAAVWTGGIFCFALLLFKPQRRQDANHLAITKRTLDQFSKIGTGAVALIVLTGLINAQIIVGLPDIAQLPSSLYGRLLLAKLLLFVLMLALAAANRWRLTPALAADPTIGRAGSAVTALRKSLVLEASAALLILALVAWLGTLEPLGGIS